MIGPCVELLGHVVRGRADQLDAALLGALVGAGAGERRQERVVDVDHRRADAVEEVAARGSACSAPARPGRSCRASSSSCAARRSPSSSLVTGTWSRGRRTARRRRARSGWLEITSPMSSVELAAAPAPEQVEQAVVVARDHDRHAAWGARRRGGPRSCRAAGRPADSKAAPSSSSIAREAGHVEDHAQEERARPRDRSSTGPTGRCWPRARAGSADTAATIPGRSSHLYEQASGVQDWGVYGQFAPLDKFVYDAPLVETVPCPTS